MQPLTPRERILRTLAFEESDIVPYHLMIDETVQPKLAEYLDDPQFESKITNHLPFFNLEPSISWIDHDQYVDAYGSTWRKLNYIHLERYPLETPSLKGYTFPDMTEPAYFEGVESFLASHEGYFRLCGIAHGFFDRGWSLRGMENFLADLIVNPSFVEEFFEIMTEKYLDLIDYVSQYPFDGIRFADDWGYQRGVLIGESRWRKFVKPGLKKIFERARSKGLVVMVHSDGDVSPIIPDLIEIGLTILNPMQPEVMDIVKIKRTYGKELCFNGGISTQLTLPMGTVDEVRREVEACTRCLGKNGGYIMSPAKAILPDVPLENAAVLIDALVNQQVCPDGELEAIPERVDDLWRVYAQFHPQKEAA